MKARCPIHGMTEFHREDICDWWSCEKHSPDDSCHSVILGESVTPDGADVVHAVDAVTR